MNRMFQKTYNANIVHFLSLSDQNSFKYQKNNVFYLFFNVIEEHSVFPRFPGDQIDSSSRF